ncbi:MAG TPA: hypothetical protein VM534_05220 [Thermoanaerobaculia bacterium]|nr:hypothetical protein [Thermoanaerobaculia bacterium]
MAICPMLGVASQGESESDAKTSLQEAVELWFESCLERGVLDQALREANFRSMPAFEPLSADADYVNVRRIPSDLGEDVLGSDFAIHLTIPAYQAAALVTP